MAQSKTDLCNLALGHIGAIPPNLVDVDTDVTKEAKLCRLFIDISRRSLLRSFIWNFAKPRVKLELTKITNAVDNGAGLIRVTKATHGFSTGNRVSISQCIGVEPANGTWSITVIDANTFDLQGSVFSGVYQSGGYLSLAPAFEFIHQHALPSDFLRLVSIETPLTDEVVWRVETGFIVTDDPILEIQYIREVTDYTLMDPLFYLALSLHLASMVCYPITQSKSLKDQVVMEFKKAVKSARFTDSIEDPMKTLDTREWLEARAGGLQDFVRDPMT